MGCGDGELHVSPVVVAQLSFSVWRALCVALNSFGTLVLSQVTFPDSIP